MLRNVILYLVSLVKYLLVSVIVGLIVMHFWPVPGLFVLGLMVLGSFAAAKDDTRKHILMEELQGFDEQLRMTIRNLQ
ncbi:MAG: hypothetical protein BAA04_05040 [Firmicutes bacterium ZCTH02-B6]|nr:MAG: hypothetical protein BAA04_05040 [Firmicutes bacterium ZCTH02-B6]